MTGPLKNIPSTCLALLALVLLSALPAAALPSAPTDWSLASPDGQCAITVSLGEGGKLSYEVSRAGRLVIPASPLGLRRDDEDFEQDLVFDRAGSPERRREVYELFSGTRPRVDHRLNLRRLTFHNAHGAPLEIDLAAANEGVAFRYRFTQTSNAVRIVESELTGFKLPATARGWMQPYHAAGPYTPAYEDFYFKVTPGDRPPDSRAKAVGWAFPALFQIPDAATWVLLTEAGTDESYCACHLAPDCTGGVYHVAFPRADETTRGYTNQFGPEPRYPLPWTMPWRVLVLGE